MKPKLPWISVETELPPDLERVFVRMLYRGEIIYDRGRTFSGKWIVAGLTENDGISVSHWLRITPPENYE